MSRRQAFVFVAIAIAVTRLLALSATINDWDETLFALGVRDYDITPHHPHPPGYPVFIAMAKVLHLVIPSDFRALQVVATIASMLMFPAVFLLARALDFRYETAFVAGALTAFLPTLWYYGGTALSDVPALCAVVLASAFLLRAQWWPAAAMSVITLGMRPHFLMVLAAPAVVGFLRARRSDDGTSKPASPLLPLIAGVVALMLIYGIAFAASSDFPSGPLGEFRKIREHVSETDSWRNPGRTPLPKLASKTFLTPFGGDERGLALLAFAGVALIEAVVRRRRNVVLVLAMFVPIAIFTWLMLDESALARYTLSYAPLYTLLAAQGLVTTAGWLGRFATPATAVLAIALTAALGDWTLPALRIVRREPSPPAAAFRWVREHVPRVGPRVFVANELAMHAEYLLRGYNYKLIFEDTDFRDGDFGPGNVFVTEGYSSHRDARLFSRPSRELAILARPRYFQVSIVPMQTMPRFVAGWFPEEGTYGDTWRWMSADGRIRLPAFQGPALLRMSLHVPVDAAPRPPTLTVLWNGGVVVREKVTNPRFEVTWRLEGVTSGANELRLITDAPAHAPGDPRPLGLRLDSITWEPASALQ